MTDFEVLGHIENINNNGFTVIKNNIDNDLINRVICDFDEWSSIEENMFKKHNFDRVTNFHIYSKNTLDLVTNSTVNKILNTLFKTEQSVYSSLFFREGTAQHYHRDTPHFYTNPIDQYYGVWYSLEDINVNAGPLKYYVGSHKIEAPDGYDVYNSLFRECNEIDYEKNITCLLKYNKNIEDLCIQSNLIAVDEQNYINKINKGDTIIWHPKLLHGGSNIIDASLTRYSMVTHNVPINTHVFNAKYFFRKEPSYEYLKNNCNFNYIIHNGINIVDHNCKPRVQKTYV
jgi:hypothetical protein